LRKHFTGVIIIMGLIAFITFFIASNIADGLAVMPQSSLSTIGLADDNGSLLPVGNRFRTNDMYRAVRSLLTKALVVCLVFLVSVKCKFKKHLCFEALYLRILLFSIFYKISRTSSNNEPPATLPLR
jgi:hypothetical protein